MSNAKKRKYELKPNAISPSEQDAVRNVMNLFRSRGEELPDALDSQNTQPQIAKDDIFGYPNTQSLDSPHTPTLIAKEQTFGYPKTKKPKTLAIKIAKEPTWIAKEEPILDSLIAKTETLDSQTTEISKPAAGKWGKYDKARKGKGLFLRTGDDITKRFKQFCIQQGLDYSTATELAWTQFMESLDSQNGENGESLAILIAHDDRRLMMWSTKPSIITLYLAYNPKNKWKMHDDKVAAAFNETDLRLLELGFIQTQFNARFKRVNSFSYYLGGIAEWLESAPGEETLNFLIKHHREQWRKATGRTIPQSGAGN